jgi:predicted anti-sigma-YlaC factor YlaD
MGCNKIKSTISRYLDGLLNEDENKSIQEHMNACPECRNFYEENKAIMALIEAPDQVLPSPYLYSKIRNNIEAMENQPAAHRWLRPVLVPAFVALTFLLAGIGSTMFFRNMAGRSGAQTRGSGTELTLQVFNDAPQSSLAQAYAKITGERK